MFLTSDILATAYMACLTFSYNSKTNLGKFSFPIIHCIRKETTDTRLLSILKQRTDDVDVKRYAQRLMRDAGSLNYTREKCARLREELSLQIEALGGNAPLLKLLEFLDVQVQRLDGAVGSSMSSPSCQSVKAHEDPSITMHLDST